MIFNIVLGCVIKAWKRDNLETVAVVEAIFYADDGEQVSTEKTAAALDLVMDL